jgi:succinate dehydrogenase/fumarate reductase flavoprotein subunit
MLPIEKTVQHRSASRLHESLNVLDKAWDQVCESLSGEGADAVRACGTAGMLAMARWSSRAALERRETRGVCHRSDYPDRDPAPARRGTRRDLGASRFRIASRRRDH